MPPLLCKEGSFEKSLAVYSQHIPSGCAAKLVKEWETIMLDLSCYAEDYSRGTRW